MTRAAAFPFVNRSAVCCHVSIDWQGVGGRRQVPQPFRLGIYQPALQQPFLGAAGKGGGIVALDQRIVVAVPVEPAPLADALVPDRGKVDRSDRLVLFRAIAPARAPVVARVRAPGAMLRFHLHPAESGRQSIGLVLDAEYQNGAHQQTVDWPQRSAGLRGAFDHRIRRQLVTGGNVAKEQDVGLDIELFRRCTQQQHGVAACGDFRAVAGGAIEADPRHTDAPNAEADRKLLSRFLDEAECAPAFGQLVLENCRQFAPDHIGETVPFGADGTVFEFGDRIVKGLWRTRLDGEALAFQDQAGDQQQRGDNRQPKRHAVVSGRYGGLLHLVAFRNAGKDGRNNAIDFMPLASGTLVGLSPGKVDGADGLVRRQAVPG